MTIRFLTPELQAAIAEVRRAVDQLSNARARAADEVSTLLEGWHGAAASEFAEAWSEWLEASSSVVTWLSGLGDALALFQADIDVVDLSSSSALDALAGRLS